MAKWLSGPPTSLTIEFLPGAVPVQICSYSFPTIIGQHSDDVRVCVCVCVCVCQSSTCPHRRRLGVLQCSSLPKTRSGEGGGVAPPMAFDYSLVKEVY